VNHDPIDGARNHQLEATSAVAGALDGLVVLELGSFIAGPFAGQLLGDLGAEVIKIEPPGTGDPMRGYRTVGGVSLWWPAIARNKRSVAIDLRDERGRAAVRDVAAHVDVVLENFRPGLAAEWGIGYDHIAPRNPAVIFTHVSGYGQTGPRASEPGFGSIAEAVGGLRHITGDPDRPPARAGVSLGDSLAALFAVIGTLAALHERSRSGRGQEVDVAIYEAVLALMESTVADHEIGGEVRGRTGGILPGVAPSNAYPCADGKDIVIAANADPIFVRLCAAMDRPDLAIDERYHDFAARAANQARLDDEIAAWTSTRPHADVLARLQVHAVPVGLINTAADLAIDPHIAARDMILRLAAPGFDRPVPMQGVVPKLSRTAGGVRHVGRDLGADTVAVLREFAGRSDEEIALLRAARVIG
jgi:crotonobetainyl-CoA:carnitine CoA-transferase CaiB-like acyl-CoA transferase